MLVTFVFGSVHAYSVLIVPLETGLALTRAEVSLVYSLALLAITLAVLFGYRIYAVLPASWLVAFAGIAAAAGLWLAAQAEAWWQLALGYGLLFGFSNGVGYGFCLQLAGAGMPHRRGFAMGAVTAAYAVGSIVFALLLGYTVEAVSAAAALTRLALFVLGGTLLAAFALSRVAARFGGEMAAAAGAPAHRRVWQYWAAYLAAVFAGLMTIGHAAAIVQALPGGAALGTRGAMLTGVGGALGGFVAGYLVDRWPLVRLLAGLPALSALALMLLIPVATATLAVGLLAVVGFAYGAVIAVYPVAIANRFGADGPRVYGRVFTAWGVAGLAAPWSAGAIYDLGSGYTAALAIAAAISALSALLVLGWRFERVAEVGTD